MVQGYLKITHIDQVYWSLGIELVFYFIIGTLFYFKLLKHIVYICIVWLSVTVLCLLFNFPYENIVKVLLISDHAPLFISGILFYKLKYNKKDSKTLLSIIVSCYFIYQVNQYKIVSCRTDNELLISQFVFLTFAYILFYLIIKSKAVFLNNKLLLFLGAISYSLYLLHNVIGYVLIYNLKFYTNNQFVYFTITTLITISLSYLVHKYFEKPVGLCMKNKLKMTLNRLKTFNA
jgi:peptidoglycan/LPS O-acetylase OafA/YrhL